MKQPAVALMALFVATAAHAQTTECKSIGDSLERLRCYDGQATPAPIATLEFSKLKSEMNAKYKSYFAHHNTTLSGSKTEGNRKTFHIKVPDPNPTLMINAVCDPRCWRLDVHDSSKLWNVWSAAAYD